MGRYYILRGNRVVEEPDHSKWAEWYKTARPKACCVASTKVQYGTVTTVFLAMNMSLAKADPPLLFETRVQGGWLNDEWERYATLAEAKAGHDAWVARVREQEEEHKLPPPGCPVW